MLWGQLAGFLWGDSETKKLSAIQESWKGGGEKQKLFTMVKINKKSPQKWKWHQTFNFKMCFEPEKEKQTAAEDT